VRAAGLTATGALSHPSSLGCPFASSPAPPYGGGMSRTPYVSLHIPAPSPGRRVAARDIVERFASEIRAGRLPAGCRVPPVRVLERQLGLSKNTVQAAYDELVARALLETREREGVFVAAFEERGAVRPASHLPAPAPLRPVPALFRAPPPPGTLRLSSVLIDPELLPSEQLAECARVVLRRPQELGMYDFQGHPALREAIAERLRRRGMEVTAEEVLITVGSQQALDVVSRALAVQGVAMEDPVYPHARLLFERNGVAPFGLPLDPFRGLDLDRWEALLTARRPSLLYAITSFQNPTGYSYSTHELLRLLELSQRLGFGLLEDDWGSDMLSDSEYRPSLRLLGGENVLHVNSFTKKLWPALRIGFVVAARAQIPALVSAKRLSILGTPPLLEAALAEFIGRGYYEAHLGRLQEELDRRYQACVETLRSVMPEEVHWTTPGGGPTLWLEVPRTVSLPALTRALAARAVEIEDASLAFFGSAPHLHGFRISYAHAPIETVRRGVVAVAEELARVRS
jgi:2-aminoadipate transaminase